MAEEKKREKAIAPWVQVHRDLTSERGSKELTAALPSHLSAEQLVRSFVTAVRSDKTGKLAQCTKGSLSEGVMLAAQLGLSLAPAMGQAYLVPFKDRKRGVLEATFIPGYRGLIALAVQSGLVERIVGRPVYQGDDFYYSYGLHEDLRHVPTRGKRGPLVASYAVAWLHGSSQPTFTVCELADIEKVQSRGGLWETHKPEMAAKTAIRRLAKFLPLSAEDRASQSLAAAVAIDDLAEARQVRALPPRGKVEVEQLPADDPWAAATAAVAATDQSELAAFFDQLEESGADPIEWYLDHNIGKKFGDLIAADVPALRGQLENVSQ